MSGAATRVVVVAVVVVVRRVIEKRVGRPVAAALLCWVSRHERRWRVGVGAGGRHARVVAAREARDVVQHAVNVREQVVDVAVNVVELVLLLDAAALERVALAVDGAAHGHLGVELGVQRLGAHALDGDRVGERERGEARKARGRRRGRGRRAAGLGLGHLDDEVAVGLGLTLHAAAVAVELLAQLLRVGHGLARRLGADVGGDGGPRALREARDGLPEALLLERRPGVLARRGHRELRGHVFRLV